MDRSHASGGAHLESPPCWSDKTNLASVQTSRRAAHTGAGVEAEGL